MKYRDQFVRQPNGLWTGPRKKLHFKGPNGEVIMPPGQGIRPGMIFVGIDIAQLCEDDADIDNYIVGS